ncbi:MAG: hypothetical protein QOF14_5771 [Hyphomicrobiales bacterium]|jgi:hypothetical protein|nr:hypothetical protein [Hyphomicrobiales bacterium]
MPRFFTEGGALARREIELGTVIAQGAVGTIHPVLGEPGIVAKIYKDRATLPEYREKIFAMLGTAPRLPAFQFRGRTYVQIAWPNAAVVDERSAFLGFLMPTVDFQASTELENILQRSARRRKQLPEFYGARVLLAANLAALMAELHILGHYMIDMKPMNMRFYPGAWYMAILDTDGFNINGLRRLPAQQFSDEYIAPEARGLSPEQLGQEQDLFALAVIIFRLLNNGIHPYQGIDLGNYPSTLQERIFAGLYAYSFTGHKGVGPAPSSLHEYFEDETRALFDRSFQQTGPRPKASEWRNHLNSLITNRTLVMCARDPKDHAHFSNGCGLCALENRLVAAGQRRTVIRIAPPVTVQSPGTVLNTLATASVASAPTPTTLSPRRLAPFSGANAPQRLVPTPAPNSPRQSFIPTAAAVVIAFALAGGYALVSQQSVRPPPQPVPPSKATTLPFQSPVGADGTANRTKEAVGATLRRRQGERLILHDGVIVRDYALQNWTDPTSDFGGQTLLKYTPGTSEWAVLGMDGGELEFGHLISKGVPQSVATELRASMARLETEGREARQKRESQPPKPGPILAELSYDGKNRAAINYNGISISIDSQPTKRVNARIAVATFRQDGRSAFSVSIDDDDGRDDPDVSLILTRLSASTNLPQAIFSYYTGGAHCCTATKIVTTDSSGQWRVLNAETLDGDGGYALLDFDGDGINTLVNVDNSFLYAFSSYAGSFAPTQIWRLEGTRLVNVTRDRRYLGYLRSELKAMESRAEPNASAEPNGYLGGWVAAKSLVGEIDEAWRKMLASYDRRSDWDLAECLINVPIYKCPQDKKRTLSFPDALRKHLVKAGYVSGEQGNRLSLR